MGEQEGKAEARTGISASGVQAPRGKTPLLALSIWSVGEDTICRDTARSNVSILAPFLQAPEQHKPFLQVGPHPPAQVFPPLTAAVTSCPHCHTQRHQSETNC